MRDHTDLLDSIPDYPAYEGGPSKVSWRAVGFMLGLAIAMLFVISQAGCAATVGKKINVDPKKAANTNGSPNTLTLADADGTWNVESAGPARYSEITADGITTVQHGSTPRDIVWNSPDGARLSISSGSDITAESVKLDQAKGVLEVKGFTTSASAPIKAGNEAFDRLIQYWTARDDASAQVLKREMEAIETVSPTLASMLKDVLRASGVPIP